MTTRPSFTAGAVAVVVGLIALGLPTTAQVGGTGDPALVGAWSEPAAWPVQAEHMALLPTGKVLAFISQQNAVVWDPVTHEFTDVSPGGDVTINCAGHAFLPDGRLLVNGGIDELFDGHARAWVFDPWSETWTRIADMSEARYYPSTVTLADGSVVTVSGNDGDGAPSETVEVLGPSSLAWRTLAGAEVGMDMYPRVHVVPSGELVRVGQERETLFLEVDDGVWRQGPPSSQQRWGGFSVLLPGLDQVLVFGGGSMGFGGEGRQTADVLRDDVAGVAENLVEGTVAGSNPASTTAEVLDLSMDEPTWKRVGDMTFARRDHAGVLLADGTVLAVGGAYGFEPIPGWGEHAVAPELYDHSTGTWTMMAPAERHRGYHQTAILLPDGRVLSAGGDFEWGSGATQPPLEHTAEIFSPPYFFQGERPTIGHAPPVMVYGAAFPVESLDASDIAKVALVRLGSVTHSVNTDQRYVELDFSRRSGAIVATAPEGPTLAPPGPYMLFLINSAGVPSVAEMVRVGPGTNP